MLVRVIRHIYRRVIIFVGTCVTQIILLGCGMGMCGNGLNFGERREGGDRRMGEPNIRLEKH